MRSSYSKDTGKFIFVGKVADEPLATNLIKLFRYKSLVIRVSFEVGKVFFFLGYILLTIAK